MKRLILSLALALLLLANVSSQIISSGTLTDDGAWCWFSDPRALYVDGDIYTGWVKTDGTIEAARFNVEEESTQFCDLYPQLQLDDHDNPAFTTTATGEVLAMYTQHGNGLVYFNKLKMSDENFACSKTKAFNPNDPAQVELFPSQSITYANPYRLSEENNRIYCFGRWTGFKPNMMWSDDDGKTFTKGKVVIAALPFDRNNRPYVKYFSDGKSRVHLVFTDGHPRNEATNSVYYAYYENGAFYDAYNHKISDVADLPFETNKATLVYRADSVKGRAWIADITADKKGRPTILYTRHPEETDHRYHYARFDGKKWDDTELCKAGKWFPETEEGKTEREPHYFGGMTVHPDNPNIIYVSRTINDVFEIERWETSNKGKSWDKEAITKNSTRNNVRPYIPRNLSSKDAEVVLWMENEQYIHFKRPYKVAIKYQIRK